MNLDKRAKLVEEVLAELFPDPQTPLFHQDHFTLLVAVVLSAQCTDKRVNSVTPTLFQLADNSSAMSKLALKEIEQVIRPCGLSARKALAIRKLSEIICTKHSGIIPCDFESLLTLPGVGRKTAAVMMAQAFHQPAFPVDTHIHRLAKRWRLSNGHSPLQTEKDLKSIFPMDKWSTLHLQMIFFGRTYCPARGHDPQSCPICSRIK